MVSRAPSAEQVERVSSVSSESMTSQKASPDGDDASALHISRHAGDVLQFHSFYRDVRNQLAGANGWVEKEGRYEHNVPK